MELWQKIALVLAGVVCTGGASWFTFGQDKITRVQMIEYVTTQAPWVAERGVIQSNIRVNAEHISANQEDIGKLAELTNQLVTRMEVLAVKFDGFLDQEKRVPR